MEQMRAREAKGWVVVDGLVVLLEQGVAQYELFTRRPAPVHVLRQAIQVHSSRRGLRHRGMGDFA